MLLFIMGLIIGICAGYLIAVEQIMGQLEELKVLLPEKCEGK